MLFRRASAAESAVEPVAAVGLDFTALQLQLLGIFYLRPSGFLNVDLQQ
jgi:hypothetical protein